MRARMLVIVLALASCTPKRTVVIDGQTMEYADAAAEQFRSAKAAQDGARYDEAVRKYDEFVEQYGDTRKA